MNVALCTPVYMRCQRNATSVVIHHSIAHYMATHLKNPRRPRVEVTIGPDEPSWWLTPVLDIWSCKNPILIWSDRLHAASASRSSVLIGFDMEISKRYHKSSLTLIRHDANFVVIGVAMQCHHHDHHCCRFHTHRHHITYFCVASVHKISEAYLSITCPLCIMKNCNKMTPKSLRVRLNQFSCTEEMHFQNVFSDILPATRIFLATLLLQRVLNVPWRPITTQIARFLGPTWVLSAPGGPHVGPINLAIRVILYQKECPTVLVCKKSLLPDAHNNHVFAAQSFIISKCCHISSCHI